MKILIFAVLLSASSTSATTQDCSTKLRVVFDVGSGATKMTAAEVELCSGKQPRLKRILDDESSVAIALEAGKDKAGNIRPEAALELKQGLEKLKDKALSLAKQQNFTTLELSAVGTHAIRTANNLQEIQDLLRPIGITLIPLSQQEEAIIGLNGVKPEAQSLCPDKDKFLVWDIGGGSQQWTLYEKGKTTFEGLPIGAEKFKADLINLLPKKKQSTRAAQSTCQIAGPSPNPIGSAHMNKASVLTKRMTRSLSARLKKLNLSQTCVVGIGGVHAKAIQAQLKAQWETVKACACPQQLAACEIPTQHYTRHQLDCLSKKLSELSDCDSEIKGPYSTTAVSNLLLVGQLMKSLNITTVHTRSINMGHALVTDAGLLKFSEQRLP
jgi:exopolyphosphatase/pppGpp-phosphohydrolase